MIRLHLVQLVFRQHCLSCVDPVWRFCFQAPKYLYPSLIRIIKKKSVSLTACFRQHGNTRASLHPTLTCVTRVTWLRLANASACTHGSYGLRLPRRHLPSFIVSFLFLSFPFFLLLSLNWWPPLTTQCDGALATFRQCHAHFFCKVEQTLSPLTRLT